MLGIFSKTRTVSRNGLIFQVPTSNFSSFRYLVHPDGTGTGWSNVEAVDVDQPHGLDYRYSQHIAKGVRKRAEHEHTTFADSTVGMLHKPGGCAILDIVDQSVDISIDDDTYKGRNLIYDQTNNAFWCFTNTDGTASTPDGYLLRIHPDRAWNGGDITWAGAHEFDGSVDISTRLYVDGVLDVLEGFNCFSNQSTAGQFQLTGTADIFGDWSSNNMDTTYTAPTDGEVHAWINKSATALHIAGQTPAGTTVMQMRPVASGVSGLYGCVRFSVKKGDTWCVRGLDTTTYASSAVYWLPKGAN